MTEQTGALATPAMVASRLRKEIELEGSWGERGVSMATVEAIAAELDEQPIDHWSKAGSSRLRLIVFALGYLVGAGTTPIAYATIAAIYHTFTPGGVA